MADLVSLGVVWPRDVAVFVAAFLLGSIPFGLLLTRLAGLGDLRRVGSGNIGATNVLRTGHKAVAALTLLLDGGKGALAVALALALAPDAAPAAAFGAVLGHMFPPWLRFRGGKGVATFLGVLLALAWPAGILACLAWLVVAALSRLSSLAALIAVAHAPVYALMPDEPQAAGVAAALAALVWLKHARNIRRLLRGEETRIGRAT